MKFVYFFISLVICAIFQNPTMAQATGVGFIPDGRIWFSNENLTIGKPTQIYTVIINNDYYSLDATVGFLVDNKIIDTTTINNLQKERAVQIHVSWQPTEGEHNIAIEFINASATDETGHTTGLDVKEFNTVSTKSRAPAPSTTLLVEKHEGNLTITDISSRITVAPNTTNSPLYELDKKWETGTKEFSKIKEAATAIADFSSTAQAKARDTYAAVKSLFDRGKNTIAVLQSDQFLSSTSTNSFNQQLISMPTNNTKLLVIIITIVLLFFLLIRILHRRKVKNYRR